jgi:hypothetical protein
MTQDNLINPRVEIYYKGDDGRPTSMFPIDASHALAHFPHEWSATPWPTEAPAEPIKEPEPPVAAAEAVERPPLTPMPAKSAKL